MMKPFRFSALLIIVILVYMISILHGRYQLRIAKQESEQLTQNYDELAANYELIQFAWATSSCGDQVGQLRQYLPEDLSSNSIAVRLSDLQCSSCIDYLLFQLRKITEMNDSQNLLVLYSADDESNIVHPLRTRLLSEASFIRVPQSLEITPLDHINIPYLMSLDESGTIQSTFLPYHVTEENIEIYLNHVSNIQKNTDENKI